MGRPKSPPRKVLKREQAPNYSEAKTYAKLKLVCTHCRQPDWHTDGCLFYRARCREARNVKRSEKSKE